jgi:hypothetical protein
MTIQREHYLQKNYELEVAKRTVGRAIEAEVEPHAA